MKLLSVLLVCLVAFGSLSAVAAFGTAEQEAVIGLYRQAGPLLSASVQSNGCLSCLGLVARCGAAILEAYRTGKLDPILKCASKQELCGCVGCLPKGDWIKEKMHCNAPSNLSSSGGNSCNGNQGSSGSVLSERAEDAFAGSEDVSVSACVDVVASVMMGTVSATSTLAKRCSAVLLTNHYGLVNPQTKASSNGLLGCMFGASCGGCCCLGGCVLDKCIGVCM